MVDRRLWGTNLLFYEVPGPVDRLGEEGKERHPHLFLVPQPLRRLDSLDLRHPYQRSRLHRGAEYGGIHLYTELDVDLQKQKRSG